MINKIIGYLNRPYPYYYGRWHKILLILATVALLSFLFSYFFEPFEVNRTEHKLDYFWICLLHALLPVGIAFVYFLVLDKTQGDTIKWTLGKEALHLSILLVLIGIGSFLIRDVIYDKPDNWSVRYFREEIKNTFLVGMLLLAVLLPLNLERLFKKYQTGARQLNVNRLRRATNERVVTIETSVPSENFRLNISDFLFAKVYGNYVEIYWKEGNEVMKKLVRLSLKDLREQLTTFGSIFQSHRSFLIQTDNVKAVSGNAQGYLLSFEDCTLKVPVSRSKIAEFNTVFTSNK
ncbi:LytTR family transcriptional regulator [Aggregatimonas sangjinii]|uniref:LytTR family transcriptional regulator n=1 Tax=Aggregatimonas sangjinii TaxID=2583587 RepID=A0A5B7SM12_9FLAO|nr:LytTR family DNA-binding domain-containing protein [Aggregatimonas sangjinii]QCW99684.1 LytTR family transcriptional regulator [Aggregatimonas sangjinii]